MKRVFLPIIFLGTLFFGGCQREKPGVYVGEEKPFSELSPTDVLVSVDGKKLTKQGLSNQVKVSIALQRYLHPRLSGFQIENLRKSLTDSGVDSFLKRELLCSEALQQGVKVGKQDVDAFILRLDRQLAKAPPKRSYQKLLSLLGAEKGKILKNMVEQDIILDIAAETIWAKQISVSEAEIDKVFTHVKNYNEMATQTNALIYAHATNIWKRIKGGEDFGKLADKYSEANVKDPGGYWGAYTLRGLPRDKALQEALPAMRVGDITPPIEADGGLMIVKLLDILKSEDELEISVMKYEKKYDLAYIFFRLPLFYTTGGRDEVRRDKEQANKANLFKKLYPDLIKRHSISYPNGDKLFSPSLKERRRGGRSVNK